MSEPGPLAPQGTWQTSPPVERQPAGRLVSVSAPCPGVTAMAFLRLAHGEARFFWEESQDPLTLAAFGIAADLIGWGPTRYAQIERQARDLFDRALLRHDRQPLSAPRLFGGFAFRDDFAPDNTWSVFRPAHFILPHYQLVELDGDAWLTLNSLVPDEDDPEAAAAALAEAVAARAAALREGAARLGPPPPQPPVEALRYPLSAAEWAEMIGAATTSMHRGELRKVVLARVCELRLEAPVVVDRALAFLNDHYPGCFRFLFEPRPDHAFYGATPELLVRVAGTSLETMGLAGSTNRSPTPAEDAALGRQLLRSAKDRYEHDVVVQSMTRRLEPLVTTLAVAPEPALYRLPNIQHLFTPIHATLREATGVLPLVAALHPTPALGGAPREAAMAFIQQTEPVPRGWYAAPIGWIDHRLDGVFGVAIRSAVSQYERIWLYAGAGIVAESVAAREWAETALKFTPMLHAFDVRAEPPELP